MRISDWSSDVCSSDLDVIADHITLKSGAAARERLPCETHAEIVGGIDDGEGLQEMVVSIAGTTDRPDGSTYHITWSLDRSRGRQAVKSNDVIAARGWRPPAAPVPVRTIPARFGCCRPSAIAMV